jgi:hypothetical protein
MIVISQGPFCWSSTPNPPTRKMVVKPCTNRNRKMWWCSILHEEQLFIIVTLRNNGKHEIVKHIQALSYLVYNHPAVCIFSEILISKCPSRAFMRNSGSINERVICGNRTQKLKMSSFRFEFSKDISVVTIYYYNRVYFQRQVISFHNVITKGFIHTKHLEKTHLCVS